MSSSQTSESKPKAKPAKGVTVRVNGHKVELPGPDVTGLEIKQAAIAQGVEIQLDFLLTREARKGHPADSIDDDEQIHVDQQDRFVANDVDDDS